MKAKMLQPRKLKKQMKHKLMEKKEKKNRKMIGINQK